MNYQVLLVPAMDWHSAKYSLEQDNMEVFISQGMQITGSRTDEVTERDQSKRKKTET